MVSQTLVVPAIRWPQPVVGLAGWQSSPPGIPPWNIFIGRMNDCKSPVQAPLLLVQVAPGAVQLIYAATETTAVVALPHPKTSNIVTQPGTAKSAGAVKGQVRAIDIGKWNQIPSAATNDGSDHNARTSAACCDL